MKIKPYYLKCKRIYTESVIETEKLLLVDNGYITQITDKPDDGITIIQLEQLNLLPGFLDLHIHGREGADIMDASQAAIEIISTSLAKHGVVGFLGTTVTSTWDNTLAAFSAIGHAYHHQPSGAMLLGAYNEGLFFTKDHKGAHDDNYFLPLNRQHIDAIIDVSQGALKVVALAPELEDSESMISYLASKNIRAMLGHTNANFQQTCSALNAGACGGVHVFNGMKGIHHRDPGCAGALLLNREAYVEVIADGVHLHPSILEIIYRMKGPDKIGLISDCIVAGGMPDGTYRLGMLTVEVSHGVARTKSGSLAGSTLTLERAVANMVTLVNVPSLEAVHMASLVPATFLGINESLGSITINKRACLTIVDDEFNVKATIVDGKLVYIDQGFESLFSIIDA